MFEVKWSLQSLEDLKEICTYIAQDSLYYAKVTNDKILELVDHLRHFPEIGKNVTESSDKTVKEIVYKNYRIIYQVKNQCVEIITLIHSRRILNL